MSGINSASAKIEAQEDEFGKADAAAHKALNGCMTLIDNICKEEGLKTNGMVYISSIVASQLLARTLFFAATPKARAKLKEDLQNQISDSLDNANRHLCQLHNEAGSPIRPN